MKSRSHSTHTPKYDAIHRSLLAGLLSNIGCRDEAHEYRGARGIRFSIFPGSALFKDEAQWIVASELVETTRLYARTVGRIQPEWIEHVAEHLVKRTYSDPHFNPETGHVVAYEKVTLYGLTIIDKRSVHYGPINPKAAREIFIQQGLVEGQYRTDAPFFRHNQRLMEEIQRLEAKSRQRDVLVSDAARYDFYDARIPASVYSGPLLERWRRETERHNPRILFMSRRDLMAHSAASVTQEMFPDFLVVGESRLPLEYHFEPGHPADGVTVTIPLPLLSQLPESRFEWLVPGLLREKITALIKSLPKNVRVNFVPAPDFADAAAAALKPGEGSLLEALAAFLSRRAGIPLSAETFDPAALLDHLHMNFRVVDEQGKQIAAGRNLQEIRRRLSLKVQAAFQNLPLCPYHRDGIVTWDFGDLPELITVPWHGMRLTGYPALVDAGSSVSLRVMGSPHAAQASHEAGLRRLFALALRDEIDYLLSQLPNLQTMCLHYATLGAPAELKEDLIAKTISRVFLPDAAVRTRMEFELRLAAGRRHRLLEVGREVADLAGRILDAYHQVALLLSRPAAEAWQQSIDDVRQQLSHLLARGFLSSTPDAWLVHYPRYLKAIQLRLEKLQTAGPRRDAAHLAQVADFWQAYLRQLEQNRSRGISDPALDQFRWMLEEFRVSHFAQELRTAIPVSTKRLQKQWDQVAK